MKRQIHPMILSRQRVIAAVSKDVRFPR